MLIKVVKVLVVIFFIRVLQSCCFILGGCSCDETPIPFNLTKITITNLDNAGPVIGINENNTMYSSAVAFEVMLSDTNQYYPYYSTCNFPKKTSGFSSAQAFSYDCDPFFTAQEKIEGIKILTIFDLNANFLAGSEVSGLFYAKTDFYPNTGLYENLENVINHLNSSSSSYPYLQLQVFLSQPVENENARFAFIFHLNNGATLTDTTHIISILSK